MISRASFIERLAFVLLMYLIWGSILLFLSINSHFKGFYGEFYLTFTNLIANGEFIYSTQGVLFELLTLCSVITLIYPFRFQLKETRVYNIYTGIVKLIKYIFKANLKEKLDLTSNEKMSLLVLMVKFVFLPLLVNFMYHNIKAVLYQAGRFSGDWLSIFEPMTFNNVTFKVLFYLILTIDTIFFVFGYLVESKKLKSEIKSVEPTLFGWVVALVCYPPYNALSSKFLGWYSNDFATSTSLYLNYMLSIFAILLFTIYVLATINLGAKASNMTNRGIVTKGAYAYVRHPAYISKNLAWWIMGIPFIVKYGLIAVFSLIAWSFIYYLRAITEERHLSADPDYVVYKKEVKYMFIPKVF